MPTNASPAQRLFGWHTRTLLPLSPTLLKPWIPQQITAKLKDGQYKQASKPAKYYNNRVAKSLKPWHTGDSVRMKLPGSNTWSCGICRKQVAPRSYLVESNDSIYRRNRRQLRKTSDKLPVHQPDIELADSDSETGEEKGNEFEPEPINIDPGNSQIVPSPRQGPSQHTSSFGRTIRPPKRYAEHL